MSMLYVTQPRAAVRRSVGSIVATFPRIPMGQDRCPSVVGA